MGIVDWFAYYVLNGKFLCIYCAIFVLYLAYLMFGGVMEEYATLRQWIISAGIMFFVSSLASEGYAHPVTVTTRANSSLFNQQLTVNTFVFNPRTLRWKAIKNGKVVKSGKGSGGKHYCKDVRRSCRTPSGTFRIIGKRGASCKSSRYPVGRGGAPMPYCMFFSKYYAIHGSPDVPNYNASHGCIRVRPSDARWLHRNFLRVGSKVIVKPY